MAKAAPWLNGRWGYNYPNYCAPGTLVACEAAITGNGRPATMTVSETGGSYRITLQAMPADGIRVTRYEVGGPCKPTLRYPAFEAVAHFRVATVRRLEREHPEGFTTITRVAVTDPSRRGIKYGAPHYSCGAPCHDDVNWVGKVVLSYKPGRSAPRSTARSPGWRVGVLVPSSVYVSGSKLAVAESGDAIVGWLQGKGPVFCAGFECPPEPPWHGYQVVVARGSVAGGFGRPVVLSQHGGGLYVAQTSAGTSYVAWTEAPSRAPRWRLLAIRRGHVSPVTLFGRHDVLLGLFSAGSGQVAAVWQRAGRGSFPFRYAVLDQRGHLGRVSRIATLHGYITSMQFAVNDHGELATAWVQGLHHQIGMLVLCDSRSRCARPRALRVPHTPTNAFMFDAVTLANNGTATDLIAGHGLGQPPPSVGLWGIVTHVGRKDGHLVKLAPSGEFPVAVSSGQSGAVAMFSPTPDTLSWTFLPSGRSSFTKPRPVGDDFTTEQPLLAANHKGQFVAAWNHVTGHINPNYIQTAATGTRERPGRPTPITQPGSPLAGGTTAVAIDGHGNAIMIWDRATSQGMVGLFDARKRLTPTDKQ